MTVIPLDSSNSPIILTPLSKTLGGVFCVVAGVCNLLHSADQRADQRADTSHVAGLRLDSV